MPGQARAEEEGSGAGLNNYLYSDAGLALTKSFESCVLTAYADLGGVWTIGYGHTGSEVKEGLRWTQQQADRQLLIDLRGSIACVKRAVKVSILQNQFDALVDFVFNVGCGSFEASTLLKDLNAGDIDGAAAEFLMWDHVDGVVVPGLLRRRRAEVGMFYGSGQ